MTQDGPDAPGAEAEAGAVVAVDERRGASEAEASGAVPRDAIIYLPSIAGLAGPDPTLDGVATRLAQAYCDDASDARDNFEVLAGATYEDYGTQPEYKSRVCTIAQRRSDRSLHPEADLYRLDYPAMMTTRFEAYNLARKMLFVVAAIALSIPSLLYAFVNRRLTWTDKFQLVWGTVILAILSSYLVILAVAVAQTVPEIPRVLEVARLEAGATIGAVRQRIQPAPVAAPAPPAAAEPASSGGGAAAGQAAAQTTPMTFWQALMILLTSLGFVAPEKWKEAISRAAANYTCLLNYLNFSHNKRPLANQLTALLDYVESKEIEVNGTKQRKHPRVHLIAYSFGSIVTLDALFPPWGKPSPRFNAVKTLATIGCPLEMIRGFYPAYFKNRHTPASVPRWINIYAPADILGTNFKDRQARPIGLRRDYPETASPRIARNIDYSTPISEHLGPIGVLLLAGFRAHTTYWDRHDETDSGCLPALVAELRRKATELEDGANEPTAPGPVPATA